MVPWQGYMVPWHWYQSLSENKRLLSWKEFEREKIEVEIDVIQNGFSGAKIDKIEVIKLKQTTSVSKFKTAFDVEINLSKSFKH